MKEQRIRANSPVRWIVCTALMLVCLIIDYLDLTFTTYEKSFIYRIFFVPFLLIAIWQCIRSVYLTEDGITVYLFGREKRFLSWSQIIQVCCVRDYRFIGRNGNDRKILFVPQNCEKYEKKKWTGLCFRLTHRKQVLWAYDSKKIRQFVELHFGEIEDQR